MYEVNWHLSSVPPELWDHIILWFSWLDILTFRRTCRFLNEKTRSKSLWMALVNRYIEESKMRMRMGTSMRVGMCTRMGMATSTSMDLDMDTGMDLGMDMDMDVGVEMKAGVGYHRLEVHPGLSSQADLEGWLWKRIGTDITWGGYSGGYSGGYGRQRAASNTGAFDYHNADADGRSRGGNGGGGGIGGGMGGGFGGASGPGPDHLHLHQHQQHQHAHHHHAHHHQGLNGATKLASDCCAPTPTGGHGTTPTSAPPPGGNGGPVRHRLMENLPKADVTHLVAGGRWLICVSTGRECAMYAYDLESQESGGWNQVLLDRMEDFDGGNLIVSDIDYFEPKQGSGGGGGCGGGAGGGAGGATTAGTGDTLAFRLALCRSAVHGRSIVAIWEIRLVLLQSQVQTPGLQGHQPQPQPQPRLLAKRIASRVIEGDDRYTACLSLSGKRLARFVVGSPSSSSSSSSRSLSSALSFSSLSSSSSGHGQSGSFIEVVNWKSMGNIRARGYLIPSERFVEGIALLPEDKLITYGKTTTVYHLREAIEMPDGGLPYQQLPPHPPHPHPPHPNQQQPRHHPIPQPSLSLWYQTFPTSPRLSQRPAALLSSALGTTAILPFPDENKIRCITIPKSPTPTLTPNPSYKTRAYGSSSNDTTPIVDEFKGLDIAGPSSFGSRRAFLRQYWSDRGREGVLLQYAFRHSFDPSMGGLKVVLDGVKVAFAHLGGGAERGGCMGVTTGTEMGMTSTGMAIEDAHLHDALPELDEATGRVVICAPGRVFGTSSVQVLDFSVYYRRFL